MFAAGIIGTGLLAVPVLGWLRRIRRGGSIWLAGQPRIASQSSLGFYSIVGAATLGGAALAVTRIDPIAMLFWSAVINGVVAVPIIVAVMLMISNRRGRMMFPIPSWLVVLGWMAAGLMAAAVGLFAVAPLG